MRHPTRVLLPPIRRLPILRAARHQLASRSISSVNVGQRSRLPGFFSIFAACTIPAAGLLVWRGREHKDTAPPAEAFEPVVKAEKELLKERSTGSLVHSLFVLTVSDQSYIVDCAPNLLAF